MPIEETVRSFREIIDGKHDDIPERAFLLKGTIEDVVEAARSSSGSGGRPATGSEETVRSFREIIEGKHDDIPERAFLLKGSIDDVVEAARGSRGGGDGQE